MHATWIKRYLPRSLFSRALLILLLPLLLMQVIIGSMFIQRHFDDVARQLTGSLAREIRLAAGLADQAPDRAAAQERLDAMGLVLGLGLQLRDPPGPSPEFVHGWLDLTGPAVLRAVRALMPEVTFADLATNRRVAVLGLPTSKGLLVARVPRTRLSASNPHQLLVLMLTASILLTGISVLFLRNQVRPIRELARAAEEFGKGRTVPYRPRGAEEVRRAGTAFLSMRARLERQMEQRTQMLSAVSHDIRTPLTRMKLALSLQDDGPEQRELLRDVNDMEAMLNEFLTFAKTDSLDATELIDPVDLAQAVVDAVAGSVPVELQVSGSDRSPADLRVTAVNRALANLIANAQRYGSKVRVTLKLLPRQLEFAVEDDGPGIPQDQREMALRPFTQLDLSRNKDGGSGVGLGLAIALDVARSHGGDLLLEDSPDLGGLRAVLRLPR